MKLIIEFNLPADQRTYDMHREAPIYWWVIKTLLHERFQKEEVKKLIAEGKLREAIIKTLEENFINTHDLLK